MWSGRRRRLRQLEHAHGRKARSLLTHRKDVLDSLDRRQGLDRKRALLGIEPDGGLGATGKPFLAALSQRPAESSVRAELRAVDGEARRDLLRTWIRERIAAVVGTSPEDIGVGTSFSELGLDSLMALELRNRIQRDLGVIVMRMVEIGRFEQGKRFLYSEQWIEPTKAASYGEIAINHRKNGGQRTRAHVFAALCRNHPADRTGSIGCNADDDQADPGRHNPHDQCRQQPAGRVMQFPP